MTSLDLDVSQHAWCLLAMTDAAVGPLFALESARESRESAVVSTVSAPLYLLGCTPFPVQAPVCARQSFMNTETACDTVALIFDCFGYVDDLFRARSPAPSLGSGTQVVTFHTGANHTFEHISTFPFALPRCATRPSHRGTCSKTLSNADDRCSLLADATVQ